MITKILVPNRGEIAARIARTCREMGITSVAAHADDDANATFISQFDETVSLGSGDARDTYLNVAKIIDAAKRCGADAIHPGYGFLSERAELARACEETGIRFIGPKADSIERMGSKSGSRRLVEKEGVPVIPGYDGDDQSIETLEREATRVGFPLLVKASSGGGGKGMKIVRAASELHAAIESGKREALKAFGDDRLLLERYIERPRHVEFQVFGDSHGNLIHMFERDCSIQRRHQKIIEESPAPDYPDELRQRMAKAAIAAARTVAYENAGTVEFVVTPEKEFYFLEMNTRLQVEHPVTESVLGIDLVRAQIDVANGNPLPWKQEDLKQRGHAIECRVYAEDPDNQFLPQTGNVVLYREPSGPGIRVDAGISAGAQVTVKYDPLLSKLIVYAENRDAAIERMLRALAQYAILGTTTNVSFLSRIIGHEKYRRGEVSTQFIPENEEALAKPVSSEAAAIAAVLGEVAPRAAVPAALSPQQEGIASVWELVGPWGR